MKSRELLRTLFPPEDFRWNLVPNDIQTKWPQALCEMKRSIKSWTQNCFCTSTSLVLLEFFRNLAQREGWALDLRLHQALAQSKIGSWGNGNRTTLFWHRHRKIHTCEEMEVGVVVAWEPGVSLRTEVYAQQNNTCRGKWITRSWILSHSGNEKTENSATANFQNYY